MRIETLKDDCIKDKATGRLVDIRKPEERVRQEYEEVLFNDYDYDYARMDIEVYIQRGEISSAKNKERADIVVYKTSNKEKREQSRDILGIVETKRPTKKEGVKQLASYMSASSALWGVWTNGSDIEYLYRDPISGEVKTNFVFQIPKNGETFEDIGRIAKNKLSPASNLKLTFRRLLNTLYSNTNISRREKLGNEMIRLIFCKIWDERYEQDALPKFRIGFNENPREVSKRVKTLFDQVKSELVGDGIFDKEEEIKLDDKSITRVVGELEKYSLLKTDKDTVGDAFEVFAESKLVGEKGEFFTPREVVKTAIKIIDPQPGQTIFDPACGSGGFLIHALEHIWLVMDKSKKYKGAPNLDALKKEIAQKNFFGLDKEIDLVKIAKAYMVIMGDGQSGIAQQNSLHTAEEFEGKAKDLFVEDDKFKKFDVILTNPPFGSKTKIFKEDAQHFDLGHKWIEKDGVYIKTDQAKDTAIQELFIERCLEMLNDGGKLAIVLPETYFHAPSTKYILEYLKKDNNIKAVIDLPHNTFRPHCNAKTVLLILEKGKPQQNPIIMAVAEEMGHDHRGEKMYRYDEKSCRFTDEIWDDTIVIRNELDDVSSLKNKCVFSVDISNVKDNIYVPRYYWQKKIEGLYEEAKKLGLEFVSVKDLIDQGIIKKFRGHGAPPSEFKGRGEIPYVRAADIIDWEVYKNPTAMVPREVYESVKGNGVELKVKDIVFVKEGSYRIGDVALLSPTDTGILLNHHSLIFRVINEENKYGIDAFYLLYLFSHHLTKQQLYNKIMIDTTLPNIGNRWEEILLPVARNSKEREKIKTKIGQAFMKKWEAQKEIMAIEK
ncbi:MAG: N-6 DNA methylase [Patescibacteria group bacterium]|nr:N-6 DNA methylase [Patescibacteria group bacterium]MCL5261871.1 N-6 DNA methylase [Patescibacteria group bacterium]